MKHIKIATGFVFGIVSLIILGACTASAPAAEVNGKLISEQKVIDAVAILRDSESLETDEDWGLWLAKNGYTPETLREAFLNAYVEEALIRQTAEDEGVSASASEVDSQFDSVKSQYNSDEEWQQGLRAIGMSETQFRSKVETDILKAKLMTLHSKGQEPSDEEVISMANSYREVFDGSKRSACIVFSVSDAAQAEQILPQLKDGSLDFGEAAKQYSQDEVAASIGGDMGWDGASSYPEFYSNAVNSLNEGEVSDILIDGTALYIIKCTEVFDGTQEITSMDQIPDQMVSVLKDDLQSTNDSSAYDSWFDELKANATIVIHEMPEGLPYDIDMSSYSATLDPSQLPSQEEIQSIIESQGGTTTIVPTDGQIQVVPGGQPLTDSSGEQEE